MNTPSAPPESIGYYIFVRQAFVNGKLTTFAHMVAQGNNDIPTSWREIGGPYGSMASAIVMLDVLKEEQDDPDEGECTCDPTGLSHYNQLPPCEACREKFKDDPIPF